MVAPIYTIFIGSLVLTKLYGKDQVIISEQAPGIENFEHKASNVGGSKPLPDLVEPSSVIIYVLESCVLFIFDTL